MRPGQTHPGTSVATRRPRDAPRHAPAPQSEVETTFPHLRPFIDFRSPGTRILDAPTEPEMLNGRLEGAAAILGFFPLNGVRNLDRYMTTVNGRLPLGGRLVCRFESQGQRTRRVLRRFRRPVARLYLLATFVTHRAAPKLPLVGRLYFRLTGGRRRVLSTCEVLGRLVRSGFTIVDVRPARGLTYVVADRSAEPATAARPTYGPICTLRRVGEGGREITVHKIRTMHPYAEYLQDYVYRRNALADGGKFRYDFRVTRWGRVLRKYWLDELPMLYDWLRGDLKLVGVRPLSRHYAGLYPPALRARRERTRPGLIPPFYADLPKTFDEILASEAAYLDAYERAPWRTDVRYLVKVLNNIVCKGARSQ